MDEFKDIFQESNEPVTGEELLHYLSREATEEQKYAIEKKLANNQFESDAVEGLQQLSKEKWNSNVSSINKKLNNQISNKKKKKYFKELYWLIMAIIIILLLIALSYVIIIRLQ